MLVEKGLLTIAGITLAGFVGYKIVRKKKPEWVESIKKSILNSKEVTVKFFQGAKIAFQEGYAGA